MENAKNVGSAGDTLFSKSRSEYVKYPHSCKDTLEGKNVPGIHVSEGQTTSKPIQSRFLMEGTSVSGSCSARLRTEGGIAPSFSLQPGDLGVLPGCAGLSHPGFKVGCSLSSLHSCVL